jgi:hypothetical protein
MILQTFLILIYVLIVGFEVLIMVTMKTIVLLLKDSEPRHAKLLFGGCASGEQFSP